MALAPYCAVCSSLVWVAVASASGLYAAREAASVLLPVSSSIFSNVALAPTAIVAVNCLTAVRLSMLILTGSGMAPPSARL
ncbi:MAG: hypothetical protein WDN04_22425 [Rhodospirillales bacterium]